MFLAALAFRGRLDGEFVASVVWVACVEGDGLDAGIIIAKKELRSTITVALLAVVMQNQVSARQFPHRALHEFNGRRLGVGVVPFYAERVLCYAGDAKLAINVVAGASAVAIALNTLDISYLGTLLVQIINLYLKRPPCALTSKSKYASSFP